MKLYDKNNNFSTLQKLNLRIEILFKKKKKEQASVWPLKMIIYKKMIIKEKTEIEKKYKIFGGRF